MNFYEELEQLREMKKQCLSGAKSLVAQQQSELETAKKQIEEKYSQLIEAKYQALDEHNAKINSHCQMIAEYSRFSTRDIGTVIASLVRTFEGINYIYQETYYTKQTMRHLKCDTEARETRRRLIIVVAEEDRPKEYSDDKFRSLEKEGKAIVLSTVDTLDNQIPFYRANLVNHCLEPCVKFGRLAYVKEFLDKVISYRIKKKAKQISFAELESLELDFIMAHIEQIKENYRAMEEQQEAQMKQRLQSDREKRQLRLRKLLDKKGISG